MVPLASTSRSASVRCAHRVVPAVRGAAGAAVHGVVRLARVAAGRAADHVAAGPASGPGHRRHSGGRRWSCR